MDLDLIPAEQEKRLTIDRTEAGKVIRAYGPGPLIVWLNAEGILDDDMYLCGEQFYKARWRHELENGAKTTRYDSVGGEDSGDNLYTQICMRMVAHELRMVHRVGDAEATDYFKHAYGGLRQTVRLAFKHLMEATEAARDAYEKSVANTR